jgi:hypothetical protein
MCRTMYFIMHIVLHGVYILNLHHQTNKQQLTQSTQPNRKLSSQIVLKVMATDYHGTLTLPAFQLEIYAAQGEQSVHHAGSPVGIKRVHAVFLYMCVFMCVCICVRSRALQLRR